MPSADAAGRGAPSATGRSAALTVFPVVGLGEIRPGDDLAALLADLLCGPHDEESPVPAGIADGDVLVVTQKVVSKAEGRLVGIDPGGPTPSGPWSRASRCGSSVGAATC